MTADPRNGAALVAQISDLHITAPGTRLLGRIDTAGHLAAAVRHLNQLDPQPDLVIATGDLVDQASEAEYRHLAELLAPLRAPVRLMPGNHDSRDALRHVFRDHTYLPQTGFLQFVIDALPVRLIALDTHEPGEVGGLLDHPRLAWLEARLNEAPQRPTMVFMHHPPLALGIEGMDEINCRGGEELGAIVARHPQIERIVCGHVHRPIQRRWHGTILQVAPSTAHQVHLDVRPAHPVRWIAEPPAALLHLWRPELGLVTHTAYIGGFGGAQDFAA